jgi:hypothetical protein
MAELLLLLFALLALESPSVSLGFVLAAIGVGVWRQRKSRKDLEEFRQDWSAQNDALHRELIDLRRQFAALTSVAVKDRPAESTEKRSPAQASTEQPKANRPEDIGRVAVSTPPEHVNLGARHVLVQPLGFEAQTTVPETVLGEHASEQEPLSAGTIPADLSPALSLASIHPSEADTPSATPVSSQAPSEAAMKDASSSEPVISAAESVPAYRESVIAPPPLASPSFPIRDAHSAPKWPRLISMAGLEETLGTNWLNKLGIVILVLGIALFGIYEIGELGPAGKVGLSCLVSAVLLGGGIYLEKKDRYRILGRTGIGGGWALLFFTAYAINHVSAMHVLDSATADSIVMLIVAGGMTIHTLRYNSQVVTGLAFLLGYSTVALSHDNVYSLTAGVILAAGLISIVLRRGWYELEFFGILSSYLNHLYWLYRLLGANGSQGQIFPEYRASTAILLFYWVTFRFSYVLRKVRINEPAAEHVSTASAIANTLLLLVTMKFQSVRPELAYIALFVIGGFEFACGQLPIVKRRREAFIVLTVLGAALMATAAPFHYSGNNVVILWVVGGEVLLIAGCATDEVVFRRLGMFAGLLAGAHLAAIEFIRLTEQRRVTEQPELAVGTVLAACAIIFYVNGLWIKRRWNRFFNGSPDRQVLTAHSYLGAFTAAAAVWALFGADWTAVGLSGAMVLVALLARTLESRHLRLQYAFFGLVTLFRVVTLNLHYETGAGRHIALRQLTLPLVAAMFYCTAWLAEKVDEDDQLPFRACFAVAGTALIVGLIYFEVPVLWQPLATMAFAVLLTEAATLLHYSPLAWHSNVMTTLSLAAVWNAEESEITKWHNIPTSALAALPVVAGCYWLAKRIEAADVSIGIVGRIAYSWMGTGVLAWVLYATVAAPWIGPAWTVFAVALVISGRWLRFKHLSWQGSVVAFCAFGITFLNDFPSQQQLAQGLSLRSVTVAIVAAGLYGISRKAVAENSDAPQLWAFVHTSAGTTLLVLLAWYEVGHGWVAAVWALFALALVLLDKHFDLEDLGWQAHVLAGLALGSGLLVDLYVRDSWHGISVRLLSLTVVAVVLYTLSSVARISVDWKRRDRHHIYSWGASALVALLLWYELQPLSVALGWAIFGLTLFEYGLFRDVRQIRYQAYVALTAAFGRIFFANLAAQPSAGFWGPRVITTAPLALIFLFIYAQLGTNESETADDRRLRIDTFLATLGTTTIVALLYFQLPLDWVVTAWAVLVFVLLAVSRITNRRIFLYQGVILSISVLVRGLVHNLFAASYFTGSDWTGRYFVVGAAVAALLAALPFAFHLRDRKAIGPVSPKGLLLVALHRPEQVLFFSAIPLLTVMLALKMRAGMVTVAWGIEGVLIVSLALAVGERSFRLTGLVLLLGCVAKIMIRDAWGLAPRDRYITFIILGGALLLVSFLYTKYRDAIRQFL